MSSVQDTIVRYVDEQLAAIFAAPRMWGTDDAIELQVLQLLETRSVALRPALEMRAPRTIQDLYHGLLAAEFPDAPPSLLQALVRRSQRQGDFIPLLRKFAAAIVRSMDPEDPFHAHDLVLRLWLREDVKVPRASTLSTYYDVFHRVLRAVSRPWGTRGRASRALEAAIDFVMPEVIVTPANDVAAHVVLPLDQVETSSAGSVRRALDQIVAINEWAADKASSRSTLDGLLSEPGAAQRVAAQALRLMPSQEAAIRRVDIGGKLIARPAPVTVLPRYASRLVEVVNKEGALSDFEEVGTVRAVDIDQGSMRLRVGAQSLKCWVEDDRLIDGAKESLGKRVHVSGRMYKETGSPPMVIVKAIRPEPVVRALRA